MRCLSDAETLGKGRLERLDLAAEDVLPALQNAPDRGVDFVSMFEVAGARVGLRDWT